MKAKRTYSKKPRRSSQNDARRTLPALGYALALCLVIILLAGIWEGLCRQKTPSVWREYGISDTQKSDLKEKIPAHEAKVAGSSPDVSPSSLLRSTDLSSGKVNNPSGPMETGQRTDVEPFKAGKKADAIWDQSPSRPAAQSIIDADAERKSLNALARQRPSKSQGDGSTPSGVNLSLPAKHHQKPKEEPFNPPLLVGKGLGGWAEFDYQRGRIK